MSNEKISWLIVALLGLACVALAGVTVIESQRINQLAATVAASCQEAAASVPALPTEATAPAPTASEPTANAANGECPRARVRMTDQLNADGSVKETDYSVSVNGQVIPGSVVTDQVGRITSALVSGDCARVAWVVAPRNEFDAKGDYAKAETVRTARVGESQITDFAMPALGPASLDSYLATRLVVGLGAPVVDEADVPSESTFELTFYALTPADGAITKVGGPYLAVAPDLQKIVAKDGDDTVLIDNSSNKKTVLAKGLKEYATEFAFSPDSANLAYLKLTGDRDTIFEALYRPMTDFGILPAYIKVQPVDGGVASDVISGGYDITDDFHVDRWTSPTVFEYTQSEAAVRVQRVDYATAPPTYTKEGLIDWEKL